MRRIIVLLAHGSKRRISEKLNQKWKTMSSNPDPWFFPRINSLSDI